MKGQEKGRGEGDERQKGESGREERGGLQKHETEQR